MFGASALLPADQLALGSGTLMMARQTSSALGVAILTAILARAAVHGLGDNRAGWIYMAAVGLLAAAAGLGYRPGRAVQRATSPGQP